MNAILFFIINIREIGVIISKEETGWNDENHHIYY